MESSNATVTWTLDLLRSIEWKRFEELCAAYFKELSYIARTQSHGPDGRVDIRLFSDEGAKPVAVVQCKAWTHRIDVDLVRAFIGVMGIEQINKGFFITTGTFSRPAQEEPNRAGRDLELIDGETLLSRIRALPKAVQEALLSVATEGDYKTPTCANCGLKMIIPRKIDAFWECPNFPRCRSRIYRRSDEKAPSPTIANWRFKELNEVLTPVDVPDVPLAGWTRKAREKTWRSPPLVTMLAIMFLVGLFFGSRHFGIGIQQTVERLQRTMHFEPNRPALATRAQQDGAIGIDDSLKSGSTLSLGQISGADKDAALAAFLARRVDNDCYNDRDWNRTVACANKRIRAINEFETLWEKRDPSVFVGEREKGSE